MENIRIEATDNTPEVDFDFEANAFALRGILYPEDAFPFFDPILRPFREHLSELASDATFTFELTYFNSSSARFVMEILRVLDGAAQGEHAVRIVWVCDDEDDNMQETGEEFAEDLEHATFELKLVETQ